MKPEMLLPLLVGIIACGGGAASAPPAEPPPASPAPAAEAPPSGPSETPNPAGAPGSSAASPALAASAAPASTPGKIDFPPHATVDQAVKAVPQGTPRTNMADDALRAPLLDLKNYDKCKVPRSTKVTMTVAVYDGAAVGVDVSTKPKNAKMDECIDGVVRSMSWSKVPSLNTVNVNF